MENDQRAQSSAPREVNPLGFAASLTAVFLTLAGLSASKHELWRDEMQAWLIGRDLPTPAAVIAQAHYEGAPPLWNLMLWGLNQISTAPELMQLATWLIAGLTFFIICYWAPFNRLHKILLLGNYYLLYQYGTVCRNYLPGILALCIACVFILSIKPRLWLGALSLIIAGFASAHTLILSAVLALALFGVPLFAHLVPSKQAGLSCGERRKTILRLAFLLGLTALGLLVSVVITLPLPDTYYAAAATWNNVWSPAHFARICAAFVASSFPLPRPAGFFWIPPWDTPYPSYDDLHAIVAAALLWFTSILFFIRSPRALITYLLGSSILGVFLYTKHLGSFRHTGLLFFTYFFASWVLFSVTAARFTQASKWRLQLPSLLLTIMLATQALTGLWAAREDYHHAFSGGKNAAEWLNNNGYAHAFITVSPDWAGAPIAGYLNRTLYYPQDNREGSFTRWVSSRDDNITHEEFYARAIIAAQGRVIVMILDRNLPEVFCAEHDIRKLTYVAGSLTPFEEYAIYVKSPSTADALSSSRTEAVQSIKSHE